MKPLILDANILVRFFVQDDPKHFSAVKKLMNDAHTGAYELRLDPMIVAETVYVLTSGYQCTRKDVANLLLTFIQNPCVRSEQEGRLTDALVRFRDYTVDFADAWLAAKAASEGNDVASFDRDLDKFNDIHRFEPKS